MISAEKSYHPVHSSLVVRGLSWVMFYSGPRVVVHLAFFLSSRFPHFFLFHRFSRLSCSG